MFLSELPETLLIVVGVTLGLLFGSFLNVVIHRLPRSESIAFPPSTCPACGSRIAPYDNIPLFSWLLLRGRARCCRARISVRYPAVELLGGLLAWAIVNVIVLELPSNSTWVDGLISFSLHLALGLGLLAAMFIDLEHLILPDEITLGGTVLGLLSIPLREIAFTDAVLGGAVGFLIVWLPFDRLYRIVRGQPGMGLGDAKLLLLAGVWFGWPAALFALLAGAVQGTILALVVFVTHGKIAEPDAVKQEREELRQELAQASPDERAAIEREIASDPVLASEPAEGLGQARLAFGPFLVVSILEYMFLGPWIRAYFLDTVWAL